MRRLRHEIAMLSIVLMVPAMLALAFPFEALDFKPSAAASVSAASPVCAFVSVAAAEQAKIFASAKSAWRIGGGPAGVAFSLGELPDMPPAVAMREVAASAAKSRPEYRPALLLPSVGARAPEKLTSSGESPDVAFAREELLKID